MGVEVGWVWPAGCWPTPVQRNTRKDLPVDLRATVASLLHRSAPCSVGCVMVPWPRTLKESPEILKKERGLEHIEIKQSAFTGEQRESR